MIIEYFFYFIRQVRIDFRQALCQIFVYGTFGNTKLFRNDTNGFFVSTIYLPILIVRSLM